MHRERIWRATEWTTNACRRRVPDPADLLRWFSPESAAEVVAFHRRLPGYRQTPLVELAAWAEKLGVGRIWVKDESHRFGLKAFKALGASYGLVWALAKNLGLPVAEVTKGAIAGSALRERLGAITCITASDGNHGRALAWAAEMLGCQAVVYLPRGTAAARLDNIRGHGGQAVVIDGTYDDAVLLAARDAAANNWLLVQDSALPGYEEVPLRVMQGYLTMFAEAAEQLQGEAPTHVFFQCGVGSYAACGVGFMSQEYSSGPCFVIVEPTKAACYLESVRSGDCSPRRVEGELDTIMAGLACGEPNPLGWKIIAARADYFLACPDEVAMHGMRLLASPVPGDAAIVSGESGAVTTGLVDLLLKEPAAAELRTQMGLDSSSRILLFSTEGDTDPLMYERIVGSGRAE